MQVILAVLSGMLGLVPLLFFVLGIASSLGKRRALRTFVPVKAVVVSQKMIKRDNVESTDYDYRPAIEYEFEVQGSTYRSTIIWSGTSPVQSVYHFSLKKAQHLLDQYPVGQTVQAFRDPDDPAQAFLVRKHPFLHEHLWTIACGFGVLMCFGVAWAFAWGE